LRGRHNLGRLQAARRPHNSPKSRWSRDSVISFDLLRYRRGYQLITYRHADVLCMRGITREFSSGSTFSCCIAATRNAIRINATVAAFSRHHQCHRHCRPCEESWRRWRFPSWTEKRSRWQNLRSSCDCASDRGVMEAAICDPCPF